jgi:predicted phage terminase large subunit-like protein
MWLVGRDPNLRIIEVSHTKDFVSSFSREISATLERPECKEIFGELKPYRPNKWTQNELLVTRAFTGKDPTFRLMSTGQATIGPRADYILCDDIVDETRAHSAIYRASIENWFDKELMSRLEPNGRIIVIGTTWNWADLHVKLSKSPDWYVIKRPAIDEHNNVLWEKRWPLGILLDRRRAVGSLAFSAQWLLDPSPQEGAEFNVNWLNYYHPTEENRAERIYRLPTRQHLRIYQAWDLAISEAPDATFTVGLTLGVDEKGNLYVLSIARGHWDFPTIMKRIEAEALAWKPGKIGIESVGFQRMIAQGLRPKLLPVIDIKQMRAKEERIRSLSANFENGRIRIDKSMDDLIIEFLHFPRGETVDILDTLEMAVRMVITRSPGSLVAVKRGW